jgi:hypothetical protein
MIAYDLLLELMRGLTTSFAHWLSATSPMPLIKQSSITNTDWFAITIYNVVDDEREKEMLPVKFYW